MNDRFKFRVWRQENPFVENWQPKYVYLTLGSESGFCKTDIIEQCTGLKDKNGKLIYEGDIVECDEGIGKVFYNIPTASLGIEFSDYSIYGSNICHYDIDVIDCVIIGNIHENKELLDE